LKDDSKIYIHFSSVTSTGFVGPNDKIPEKIHKRYSRPPTYVEGVNKTLHNSHNYLQVDSKKLKNDAEVAIAAEMVEASYNMMLVSLVTYIVQLQGESHDQMFCCHSYIIKAYPERPYATSTTLNTIPSNNMSGSHHKVIITVANQH